MARKSEFLSKLITEEVIGSKYAILASPFGYYSKTLGREIWIPTGFVCDYESIPLFKSDSKRAGCIHDYLSRIDSDPVLDKLTAAAVYFEAQALRDELVYKDTDKFEQFYKLKIRWFVRKVKTCVVKYWPGYFHKHSITAVSEIIYKEKL